MTYFSHQQPTAPVYSPKRNNKPTCRLRDCDNPISDNAFICWRCTDQLRSDLDSVESLLEDLVIARTRQSHTTLKQPGGGKRGKDDSTPLPYDGAATEAYRKLAGEITRWSGFVIEARIIGAVGPVCDQCRHDSCATITSPKPYGRGAESLATWLTTQIGWIRRQEAGWKFAAAIARRVDRARQVIDLPDGWAIDIGPCPEIYDGTRCTGVLKAWLAAEGSTSSSEMSCPTCGKTYEACEWTRTGKRIKAAAS